MMKAILSDALESACGREPSRKTLNTSLIMIKDKDVMDMIGVFYMMVDFFSIEKQTTMVPDIDRKLDIHELVDLIKSRNDAYAPVTVEICAAMNHLLYNHKVKDKLPDSCRGRKWFAVGYSFTARGSERDESDEWENEAMSIYKKMVKDSDELKASLKPSLATRVGVHLGHGFNRLLEPRPKGSSH